jgi:hypothetical protein
MSSFHRLLILHSPQKLGRRKRENDRGVNVRHIVSTHVNITMYPPVQLLYANEQLSAIKVSATQIQMPSQK